MTTDKAKDGGPAFPGEPSSSWYFPGMTLRDWFAGQALAGLIGIAEKVQAKDGGPVNASHFAISAYEMADAMLAARSAKP
jgi:uncharacterized protein YodC (DUF2158 family)